MFYQKMLIGFTPYFLSVGNVSEHGFDTHYHYETEICFCMGGKCNIVCEGRQITLSAGDSAVISPMSSHSVVREENNYCEAMVLEFGQAFLGRYYDCFSSRGSSVCVIRKDDEIMRDDYMELIDIVEKTAEMKKENSTFDELFIRSNLYKIAALLIGLISEQNDPALSFGKSKSVSNVEKALEMIYNRYGEALDIETVSSTCGYSKSNFCKIFKKVTGETFHNVLNRHRVEIACHLLKESSLTIEEISRETGFPDLKGFCRVFKNEMNMSAGEYRRSNT